MGTMRIGYIDSLKVLGLLLVILAHVSAPDIILQIRSFDVPLLVFISAYLAGKTYKPGNIIGYYKKRILRLAVPTWIFLVVFTPVYVVAVGWPGTSEVLKAFYFQRDNALAGMVWVIWVYLVCAFLVPVIKRAGFNKRAVTIVVALVVVNEILCIFTPLSGNRFLYNTFFTAVPYGAVCYLGFYFKVINRKMKRVLTGLSAAVMVFCMIINGGLLRVSDFKYPARAYYLSYGVLCVLILIPIYMYIYNRYDIKNSKIVNFISSSSLWVYLWHILTLYTVKYLITNDSFWMLQYVLIVTLAVLLTYIQNRIVDYLISKYGLRALRVFKG